MRRAAGLLLRAGVLGWACAATATAQSPGTPLPPEQVAAAIAALDGIVETAMQASGVPGVAVAVVQDGKTVFARGYGLREIGQPGVVTPDTVFQIASLSKSLSATVVASQIGQNGVTWTAPVQALLPSFALADPWVGEHVTIGDLFAHRSGLPEHAGDDLEDLGFDRAAVLERLPLLPLDAFRTSYAYTNFGLTAAAEAVATAAGTDWASLSENALFAPLGMSSTSMRFADYEARADRAIGHTMIDGAFVPYRSRLPDPQAPAGGASSTVTDFARWMAMVLAGGAPILDAEALTPAITAQVISRAAADPTVLPQFYGFGVGVGQSPSGRTTLSHSGAFVLGAATRYVMLPEAGLGIVVFSNALPVGVPEAIAADFIDLAEFGVPQRDWLALFTEVFAPFRAPEGALAGKSPPADATPAAPLIDYAGSYDNAYFGPAKVTQGDGGLTLQLGPRGDSFALTHWSADTFVFPVLTENMPSGSRATVVFADRAGGATQSFTIDYLNAQGWGEFRR
jgi:CubicO group peptidase (beta-lactamase class C family)